MTDNSCKRRKTTLKKDNKVDAKKKKKPSSIPVKNSPVESDWRKVIDDVTVLDWVNNTQWIGACHNTTTRDARSFASICGINDIKYLISLDYGETGKCNYYKTDDIFGNSPAAIAFPVCVTVSV